MSVSYDSYKVFYVTATEGSFTAAAQALFVTQPSVTHAIKTLENELGCRLFVRSRGGVELTHEGSVLMKYVKTACENIIEAEEVLNQLKKLETGEISIGANETTLHNCLLPQLAEYHEKYPGIRLKISNDSTPAILSQLEEGKLDCAVIVAPKGFHREGLIIEPLSDQTYMMIAGMGFQELSGRVQTLRQLEKYPLVGFCEETISRKEMEAWFAQHQAVYRPDIELATADLIVPVVVANLGIGLVPSAFTEEALAEGKIFQVRIRERLFVQDICLIYAKDRPHPLCMNELLEQIRSIRKISLQPKSRKGSPS